MNTTKDWIRKLNPETLDEKITGMAFIILTKNSGCYTFDDAVDNRNRINLIGSLEMLKCSMITDLKV